MNKIVIFPWEKKWWEVKIFSTLDRLQFPQGPYLEAMRNLEVVVKCVVYT